MAQAKTLIKEDIMRVIDCIKTVQFVQRIRATMLITHITGLRIGEVACFHWRDAMNLDSSVKDEIRLLFDMTKGEIGRRVYLNAKLCKELPAYALKKCAWYTAIHSLQAKSASRRDSMQIVLLKHLPCCKMVQEISGIFTTAHAEVF